VTPTNDHTHNEDQSKFSSLAKPKEGNIITLKPLNRRKVTILDDKETSEKRDN